MTAPKAHLRVNTTEDAPVVKGPPRIIAGFPGVGKSFATKCLIQLFDMIVSDSDSSKFPKDGFPENYIDHIRQLYKEGSSDIIFVSSHDVVREALIEAELPFTLVYPNKGLKKEYLRRYTDRNSPQGFIDLVSANWDTWLDECNACVHQDITRVEFPNENMSMYLWILISKGVLTLSPETGGMELCLPDDSVTQTRVTDIKKSLSGRLNDSVPQVPKYTPGVKPVLKRRSV